MARGRPKGSKNKKKAKPHWSEAAKRALVSGWLADDSARTIAQNIRAAQPETPRTWRAIHGMAERLGLPFGTPQGYCSIPQAAQEVGVSRSYLLKIAEIMGVAVSFNRPGPGGQKSARGRNLRIDRDEIIDAAAQFFRGEIELPLAATPAASCLQKSPRLLIRASRKYLANTGGDRVKRLKLDEWRELLARYRSDQQEILSEKKKQSAERIAAKKAIAKWWETCRDAARRIGTLTESGLRDRKKKIFPQQEKLTSEQWDAIARRDKPGRPAPGWETPGEAAKRLGVTGQSARAMLAALGARGERRTPVYGSPEQWRVVERAIKKHGRIGALSALRAGGLITAYAASKHLRVIPAALLRAAYALGKASPPGNNGRNGSVHFSLNQWSNIWRCYKRQRM